MINAKSYFYNLLTTALPGVTVLASYPDAIQSYPLVTFQLLDNSNQDEDLFDNQPICDHVDVQVDFWSAPGVSNFTNFNAVNTAMESANFTREAYQDLVDLTTKALHTVARFSGVLYR